MLPSSRILAAGRLLRGSRFDPQTAAPAAAGFQRLNGANRPGVPKPLSSPLLGGFGPNCGVPPGNGVPFGRLGSFLPGSTYPPHGKRLTGDTVIWASTFVIRWIMWCLDAVVGVSILSRHNTYVQVGLVTSETLVVKQGAKAFNFLSSFAL